MNEPEPLHLFQGFGIELEYMIVDSATLCVRPIADELLRIVGGGYEMEVALGEIAWSNELALHLIELKTNGPASSLSDLSRHFQANIQRIQDILAGFEARLLPTAMHPWMDPGLELRLWSHEDDIIYKTLDRIFNCKGHGWANLQSTHINLPFANDSEFDRLHTAIRLVLPILPALAASSPIAEGKLTGLLDTRLEVYRKNSDRIPSIVGHVIPESISSRADYEDRLLRAIYADLAPLDPEGVLHHEWVNARGCIPRFERMALEIRLMDVQECPRADIAVAAAVIAAVRALVEEVWDSTERQRAWDERELAAMLLDSIRDADDTVIDSRRFLETFGYPERGRARARELWQHLIETLLAKETGYGEWEPVLRVIAEQGCLARRIAKAVGNGPSRTRLEAVYRRLADCLAQNEVFEPAALQMK